MSDAAPAPHQRKDEPRKATRERPLSPHLQVYRWQITMTMSILHRASGVILTFGAFALAWWLMAVATGGESYDRAARCLASPFGKLILFGFSLALVYHLLNGIRHLLWDAGPHRGFHVVAGGAVCPACRPPGSAAPAPETFVLLSALLAGDWVIADASDPQHRREGSGLTAAFLQWHLERGIRSLRMVER